MNQEIIAAKDVAGGYLELGLAGAALLTIMILAFLVLRWAGKQRDLDRKQFSEQLSAERAEASEHNKQHVEEMKGLSTAVARQAELHLETTQEMMSEAKAARADFTNSMRALTSDQIELAKLRAQQKKD